MNNNIMTTIVNICLSIQFYQNSMLKCLYNIYQNFKFLEKLPKDKTKDKNRKKKLRWDSHYFFFNFQIMNCKCLYF